jgi:hypothetical protein
MAHTLFCLKKTYYHTWPVRGWGQKVIGIVEWPFGRNILCIEWKTLGIKNAYGNETSNFVVLKSEEYFNKLRA